MSEIEQVTFIDNLVTGKFQAYTDEMFGATDPDLNYVWLSPTTANPPIALNFARNKDDALETALQQGRTMSDPADRIARPTRKSTSASPQDLPYLWASLATWSSIGSNAVQNFNNLTLPDGSGPSGSPAASSTRRRCGARTEHRALPCSASSQPGSCSSSSSAASSPSSPSSSCTSCPATPPWPSSGPTTPRRPGPCCCTSWGSTRASWRSTAPGSPTSSTATWARRS